MVQRHEHEGSWTKHHGLQEASDLSDLDGEEELDREVEVIGARVERLRTFATILCWLTFSAKHSGAPGLKDLIINQDMMLCRGSCHESSAAVYGGPCAFGFFLPRRLERSS